MSDDRPTLKLKSKAAARRDPQRRPVRAANAPSKRLGVRPPGPPLRGPAHHDKPARPHGASPGPGDMTGSGAGADAADHGNADTAMPGSGGDVQAPEPHRPTVSYREAAPPRFKPPFKPAYKTAFKPGDRREGPPGFDPRPRSGFQSGPRGDGPWDRPPPRAFDDRRPPHRDVDDRRPPGRNFDDRRPPGHGFDDRRPPDRGHGDRPPPRHVDDRRPPERGFDDRRPPGPRFDRDDPRGPGRDDRPDHRPGSRPAGRPDDRRDDRRSDTRPGPRPPFGPGPRPVPHDVRPPVRPPSPSAFSPTGHGATVDGTRLSKVLADRGAASRREVDDWIAAGWVRVDGKVATLGQRVKPQQQIDIDPRAHGHQSQRVTILLNKPIGHVSGQPEDGHPPAVELLTPANHWADDPSKLSFHPGHLRGLAPAGRLDIDSTGLLVLTQDGRVARHLIGEDSRVEKEYLVRVEPVEPGPVPESSLALMRHGMVLDDKPLKPAQVSWANEDQLRVVLREGRKRQIRRMCEAVGLKVVGLKRVRIGRIPLGKLPSGQWRYLGPFEEF